MPLYNWPVPDVVLSQDGNTAGNTGQTYGTLALSGGNNITLSQSTGTGGATIGVSGPNTAAQTVQTQNLFDLVLSTAAGGATAGTMGTVSSGSLTLYAGSNITLSQSATNKITIIGPTDAAQTVQTQNLMDLQIATGAGGTTTGTTALVSSGTFTLVAGNNITLSQAGGNAVTISAFNQSVQTQNLIDLQIATGAGGTTTGTTALVSSGTLTLVAGNNITLSQAGGNAITISGGNAGGGGGIDLEIATAAGGTTTGTTALVSTGTLTLFAGNNITLSQTGTNAITISAFNQSVQTQNLIDLQIGTAAGGTTTGTTAVVSSGTLSLFAGNNITLSQTGTNAITISGATVPPTVSMGISTQGNTAGTTGFASQSLQLVGTNLITMSQSTGAGAGTITVVGPRVPGMTRFDNGFGMGSVADYVGLGTVNGSMHLFPLTPMADVFPGNMSALTMFVDMYCQTTTATSVGSGAFTLTVSAGIFTLAGGSSLSLLNSVTTSLTQNAATGNTSLWYGARWLSFQSSQFSASLTFSQTSYWVGLIVSSSSATQNFSWVGQYIANTAAVSARSGTMGSTVGSNATRGYDPWTGIVNTNALPASVHISNVTKTGVSGGFVGHVVLDALHSAW